MERNTLYGVMAVVILGAAQGTEGQEPVAWGEELSFHTFSIAAVDPGTGESGVAVTTRQPCVGNGVPWVRAGVGAVATQASTRTEYGLELLDLLEAGIDPASALAGLVGVDDLAPRRQVGVVAVAGGSAQHTGAEATAWAGHRAGPHYVTQGNILVGPEVLAAVAENFEASQGSHRHLADRLVEALEAGDAAGGDARKGRVQSAAVVVADPRAGVSRRPDGITVHINVCQHPDPVAEVRRIHDAISQRLGHRTLEQQQGEDLWQLRVILHALGHYRPDASPLPREGGSLDYTPALVEAVEGFREEQGLSTAALGSPPGLVDRETVELLWEALDARGVAEEVRRLLLEAVQITR